MTPRKRLSSQFAGQVRDGTRNRRGGIGFMSTQKRESRRSPAARLNRHGEDCRRRLSPMSATERAGARGVFSPVWPARNLWAGAGGTAPHLSILESIWFWMVTKFLLKDQPIRLPVRPVSQAERPGSPPPRAGRVAANGMPASPGHPAIPFPVPHARLHPALPQAPAKVRRAERYDGQGNLYLFYAA